MCFTLHIFSQKFELKGSIYATGPEKTFAIAKCLKITEFEINSINWKGFLRLTLRFCLES